MFDLTRENASAYLASRMGSGVDAVTELGGGVSNTVLLVENADGRFVVKQSLARLRVADEWLSDRARTRRECAVLRALEPFLPEGALPHVVFEDAENFLFAMTAALPHAETWKAMLLRGVVSEPVAARAGRLLSAVIRAGRDHPELLERFAGRAIFDELRLDPYYRATARRHPALAAFFEDVIAESNSRCYSLVHGDWSPKNLLVAGDDVTVIDWEVIHAGDPSFDAAFLTNHLLLKGFHRPQWQPGYAAAAGVFWAELCRGLPPDAEPWFEAAALRHLGALLLARIDGKSPAEYITGDTTRERIRRFAFDLITEPPAAVPAVFARQGVCR